MKTRLIAPFVFIFCILFFFKAFFFSGLLPIPSDLVVGLFHPFRDSYAKEYPMGVPFKNFLLTDPVTQQIPWRELSLQEITKGKIPLWNPYQMAGYPLLANIQSAPFYPLNLILVLMPFSLGWSLIVISQPLIAMIGMYLFLRKEKVSKAGGIFGSIVFAFCGFMVAWLEWGTIGSTAAWMPLMLYFYVKVTEQRKRILPIVLLVISIVVSYLAGHIQTFFYEMGVLVAFMFFTEMRRKSSGLDVARSFIGPVVALLLLLPLISMQFQFIGFSARMVDLNWHADGWFIPWQNLIQFIAPNFFGNPATGNDWGVWNYGEFLGYIGILPLILAILALVIVRTKKVFFFGMLALISLFMALPTVVSSIPFQLQIPFLSTAQPTRMLFVVDFSLAVLAAFGIDSLRKASKKTIFLPLSFILLLFLVFLFSKSLVTSGVIADANWAVAQRNLVIPVLLVALSLVLFIAQAYIPKLRRVVPVLIIIVTIVDLFLVMQKFTPFTNKAFYYPATKALTFLKDNAGINRVMSTDRRILHPNIATQYKIQTIEGYDPLYLLRFGQLLAASNRQKPDISSPFGFSRILTTDNYKTPIIDLLGVKYVLSLNEIVDPSLVKIFEEGATKIYQNKRALPRVFFAEQVERVASSQEAISFLYEKDLSKQAVVETSDELKRSYSEGVVEVLVYEPNKVVIKTANKEEGFLVLTDSYYPTWKAYIDDEQADIYLTDFTFRGVVVPKGEHRVEFINTPFAK